ncbi:MAG TPA: toll/interleukin-1 receptor domain-containing protein [Thermoanaerobaculia bacterium]|nr:toll/interleukin-1 receptor domain-containing protein [Thermoanaerobaculia bacterium]
MENLTFALGVIKQHDASPLEGHTVVVLERVSESGEEFRCELRPGQALPRAPFRLRDMFLIGRRVPSVFAFAVSNNSELRVLGTVDVRTQDQTYAFAADIHIEFRVADPRLVVTRRQDDPVARIRDEARALAARELAWRDWPDIRHRFREVGREIVDSILTRLRGHSANYGLWVSTVSLGIHAGDRERAAIHEEIESERRAEQREAELRNAIKVQEEQAVIDAYERQKMVFDAAAEAAASALRNIGSQISNVDELAQVIELSRRALGQLAADERPNLLSACSSSYGNGDPGSMEVAFRAVWPSAIEEASSSLLTVYASVGSEGAAAVAFDIRQGVHDAASLSGTAATHRVSLGARIRIVPAAPGLVFSPPSITLPDLSSWLRATFAMRLREEPIDPGEPITGTIQFFVGPLIVGHLAFSITVRSSPLSHEQGDKEMLEAHGHPHRRIFLSYSHRDTAIVTQVERVYKLLGDSCLRDVDILHSGDDWRRVLLNRIGEADVFQLFWSRAARASRNVEEEWRHALRRNLPGFICPVYWQKPRPHAPVELAHLHFEFYEIPRRSVQRKQRTHGAGSA